MIHRGENHISYYNDVGTFHREDGPAIEWNDGYQMWYLNGFYIGDSNGGMTNEIFLKLASPKYKLLWNGNLEELRRLSKIIIQKNK